MIAISRKREQNSAYATKRGPYGAPDTGLDHSKETYRRDYVARDAATGRRHADTPIRLPPYCASLSIFAASMKSRSVSPPAECVDRTSFTVFHRMSISG